MIFKEKLIYKIGNHKWTFEFSSMTEKVSLEFLLKCFVIKQLIQYFETNIFTNSNKTKLFAKI